MADLSKFRSALNGFHRTDVVNYIESTSLAHQKEVRQLKEERELLKDENASLSEKLAAAKTKSEQLQKELDAAKAQLEQLREEDASLQQQIEALALEATVLAEQAAQCEQAAEEEEEADVSLAEKELEAYRRAEAMERNALLRAERLNSRMSELCESARNRYADAGEEIAALSADLNGILTRLQEAVADACIIFDETEDAFDTVQRPDGQLIEE